MMAKKEDQFKFNLTVEEFPSLVVDKLNKMQVELEIITSMVFGTDIIRENERKENEVKVRFSEEDFVDLVVNKLADIQVELELLSSYGTMVTAAKQNEQEENSGDIFRNNDEQENLEYCLEKLLEKNRKYSYERKLNIIADMIDKYANNPGSGLNSENGTCPMGPQRN
jgi:hypothetical protein